MGNPQGPQTTHYYKTDAISALRTSMKTFDALGIVPHDTVDNSHRRHGHAYIYTRRQVLEAAIRLRRKQIYIDLGGDMQMWNEGTAA